MSLSNDPETKKSSAASPLPPALVHPENRPELAGDDLGFLFAKVMIVDDEPVNVKVVRKYLQGAGYTNFLTTTDSTTAMGMLENERPDIVLLDVMMPQINGLQILEWIRADARFRHLPVVILTASTDSPTRLKALELGATDFLPKPIDSNELLLRVRNVLIVKAHQDHLQSYSIELEREVQFRTMDLELSRLRVFQCLARAGEYRDDSTGRHVYRVGRCVAILASEFGFDRRQCGIVELAAQLHDIGKIGIPDSILLKPGKLTPEEFALMRKHCEYGKAIIAPPTDTELELARQIAELGVNPAERSDSPMLNLAATIAMTHHERFDGHGYPCHLQGTQIPLEGRLTAIADTFDALRSHRPYKPALEVDRCIEIMRAERSRQFDPDVYDAFSKRLPELVMLHQKYADRQHFGTEAA
jgi:putative two-component system response regulator